MDRLMRPAIVLVLEGRVPDGGQLPLERFFAEATRYYESHDGTQASLHWDVHDKCRFREVFAYKSEEAFEADDERTKSDPVMRSFLARWHTLLVGPPEVSVWRNVANYAGKMSKS